MLPGSVPQDWSRDTWATASCSAEGSGEEKKAVVDFDEATLE